MLSLTTGDIINLTLSHLLLLLCTLRLYQHLDGITIHQHMLIDYAQTTCHLDVPHHLTLSTICTLNALLLKLK